MKKPFSALALARGASVLVMPSIHTVMLYSNEAVADTWLGYCLRFFAECVSSHLYMFLMGFFISITERKTVLQVGKRSLVLLFSGYLLNGLRTYIPALLGVLPDTFLHHYGATTNYVTPLLFTGDILQFAGLGYLLTALMERVKHTCLVGGTLFFVVALVSPFLWGIRSDHPILNYGLALLTSNDSGAFFPLFPWLCYPLAGMIAGKWLHSSWLQNPLKVLLLGLGLVATGAFLARVEPVGWEYDFYRSGLGGVLLHTGMIGLWLLLFQGSEKYLEKARIKQVLLFGNRHITAIYVIHWIVVGWGMGIAGYRVQPLFPSLLAIVAVNLISYYLIRLYIQVSS